jgi:nucleotide-binding universal stress UspA family protein
MAFEKVLVPLDRSNLNFKVLDTALSIADRYGSQVVALRIRKEGAALDMEGQDHTRIDLNVIEEETNELIAEALKRLGDGHSVREDQVRAEVRSGPVVDTIVAAAAELMVDLIVMGTHGRKGPLEFFTGSTTEKVVAKTPASVMVIKPSGFPYLRD